MPGVALWEGVADIWVTSLVNPMTSDILRDNRYMPLRKKSLY